jgi:hypothetical protein
VSRGKQGGSTGGMEYLPARSARRGAVRKRENRRWAALAGPVTVTRAEGDAFRAAESDGPCSAESEAFKRQGDASC